MIVSLFYVVLNLVGLSFLEKGGKALLLGSVFPVKQTFNDLTGLDRAWWFCHHINTLYIFLKTRQIQKCVLLEIISKKSNFLFIC